MKITTFLPFFLLITLPHILFAAPLTLDQCVERGLEFNPQIKASQIAVEESEQGIGMAWGAFLPSITLSYNNINLHNGDSGERDADYLDQQSDTLKYQISQPLFTGLSGLAGLQSAKNNKKYHQYELLSLQQRLVFEIKSSFYEVLLQQQLVRKWQDSIKRLQSQHKIISAWVAQRLAPKLRTLEVNVDLANANQQLASAQANLAIAQAQLHEWLAINSNKPLAVSGDLSVTSIAPVCNELSECADIALVKRPEQNLIELSVELARQDAKAIRARNLPRVALDAAWVDYQRTYDNSDYPEDDRDYYSVTLNVTFRPFQGGRNIFAWRQKKLTIKRLQQQQLVRRHAIITEVQTAFQQYVETKERIDNSRTTLDTAKEAYTVAAKSAELGVASLRDLLDAGLRLTRAELGLTKAQADHLKAGAKINYAIGAPIGLSKVVQ